MVIVLFFFFLMTYHELDGEKYDSDDYRRQTTSLYFTDNIAVPGSGVDDF